MEAKYNLFPQVGATFKKLMEIERFDELTSGRTPVYTFKKSKELLEEMKSSPMPTVVKLWFASVTLAMKKVQEDCQLARVDFSQDDMDKVTYFANKVIKAFAMKPDAPILIAELLKDHYGINFSGLKREEMYEKMSGIIDRAVEEKKKRE